MTGDNPFKALDKMLFTTTPPVKPVPLSPVAPPKPKKKKKAPIKKSASTETVDQPSRPTPSTKMIDSAGQPTQATKSVDPTNRPKPSTHSVDQPINQLLGEVVKRPLAFYLPVAINEQIETAVSYYQQNHHKKIDRSALVSALLDDPQLWTPQHLDRLAKRVLAQLKNRFNDRLSQRLNPLTD